MHPEIYKNIYSNKNRKVFLNYLENNMELNSNILEVGPGPGLSTHLIKKYGKEITLIEPNKDYFEDLKRQFFHEKFKLYNGYLNESPIIKYDAIIMVFNVMNHISFDEINNFITNLKIRSKKNTKIYFDMYNSLGVKEIPPKEVFRDLGNERILNICPSLKNNILKLTYKIDEKIIEEMNLYLHDLKELMEKFLENGFNLQKKDLLGRSGDSYFFEVYGFYG